MSPPSRAVLAAAIEDTMLADRAGLRRALERACDSAGLQRAEALIGASRARVEERRRAIPAAGVREDLPIAAHAGEIAAALHASQVVVVCGETGSGKSTQLPRLCLAAGRGLVGMIGHTQPRRIAARSIAARLRAELGLADDASIASKVRFDDASGPRTLVKLMTDGIALEELRHDRQLLAYDTLIIDEAHERSLNIDILLGYLRTLLPRRPELRVIITSATIEPQRFADHFGGAPIIEVGGRSYPISTRYEPPPGSGTELAEHMADAVAGLLQGSRGDILAFLPTERDIRDTARWLHRRHVQAEVLPLFARLDAHAQAAVFNPGPRRRVILATNVAETSLTVPRIRYVVDSGLARVSRYSPRAGLQRLPVEPISRAAAEQRQGRCGRIGPGICVRLYSEADFLARPEHTEPEILRTGLAAVILRLHALGLARLEAFPFLDRPHDRYINDGYRLLGELGAMDERRRLTRTGKRLAMLPLDPQPARMLLGAEQEGALEEVLIIVAALSVADVRERPLEAQAAADEQHARFADRRSDFLWYLNAWQALHEAGIATRALRRFCNTHYLAYHRVREWRDVHRQLRDMAREQGWRLNTRPADYARIHRALLAGLLGQVARREDNDRYIGARGRGFNLFPGSALRARPPEWIMAAELVETARVFGRNAARVNPGWIRRVAGDLVQRRLSEPYWDRGRGEVMARETLTLFGLVLSADRQVPFGRAEPALARDIFISEALVAGELDSDAPFLARNRDALAAVRRREARLRRHDLLAGPEQLEAFFQERLPAQVCSAHTLAQWLAGDPARDALLRPDPGLLVRVPVADDEQARFPQVLECAGVALPLAYRFDPLDPLDGVTVRVPEPLVGTLEPARLDWLVPGHLPARIEAILRALPKSQRRRLVPIADTVAEITAALTPPTADFWTALAGALEQLRGLRLRPAELRALPLPAAACMHVAVVDAGGRVLAVDDDAAALKQRFAGAAAPALRGSEAWPHAGEIVPGWDFGTLPATVTTRVGGVDILAVPCLRVDGDSVRLELETDPELAAGATAEALVRLVQRRCRSAFRRLQRLLRERPTLQLAWSRIGPGADPLAEFADAVTWRAFAPDADIRDAAAFAACCARGEAGMFAVAARLLPPLEAIMPAVQAINARLAGLPEDAVTQDLREQLAGLVFPGFLACTDDARLGHLPRYLEAMQRRLDRLQRDRGRDAAAQRELAPFLAQLYRLPQWRRPSEPGAAALRWAIEEYRVSLFAQDLGTAERVSATRLRRLLEG